jgi:hypothetical protein
MDPSAAADRSRSVHKTFDLVPEAVNRSAEQPRLAGGSAGTIGEEILQPTRNRDLGFGVVVLAAIAVALFLYRPWQRDPLPIRDFAGTISLLSSTSDVGSAYDALMTSYTHEGRFQPVFMFGFAAQWSVFGTNSIGWQAVRFALLLAVMALAVVFAVRCGATWIASAVAVALWFVASGSHEAWFLLQLAEPSAALLVAISAVLATFWRSARYYPLVGLALSASLLLAVLSKETMIVAVPFVVAIALCRDRHGWASPELSSRTTVLLLTVVLVIALLAMAPILDTRENALAGAYASRFDVTAIAAGKLSNAARAILLPVTRVPWFPANVLFGAVLLGGWVAFFRTNSREAAIAATVLLCFPLGGILLYAAWPGFPGYYAMPFALSTATMLALSLTALRRHSRPIARGAFGAIVVVAIYGALFAWNGAQADRAIRGTDWAAVQMMRHIPSGARLVVGVPDPAHAGDFGRNLSLYAAAIGTAPLMPAEDVTCRDAVSSDRQAPGAVALVLFSHLCGADVLPGEPPAARSAQRHVEIEWKTLRPRRKETSVSLWISDAR